MVIDYLMILFIFVPFMVFWRRRLFRTLAAEGDPKVPSPASSASSAGGSARRCAWAVLRALLLPTHLLFAPARASFWVAAAPILHRARYACLVGWAGLLAAQAHYASRIEASSSAPSVFDADHNLSRFVFLKRCGLRIGLQPPPHRVAAPVTYGCRYAFGEAALALNDAPSNGITGSQYAEQIEEWMRSTEGQTCLQTCKLSELYDQRCQV